MIPYNLLFVESDLSACVRHIVLLILSGKDAVPIFSGFGSCFSLDD